MTAESHTIFVYDTETNKLPLWGKRSSHPLQPHMVQIAAALFDAETRLPLASLNLIIRPDGWDIEEGTIDVHGITPEHAERAGIPEPVALAAFFSARRLYLSHFEPLPFAMHLSYFSRRFCSCRSFASRRSALLRPRMP